MIAFIEKYFKSLVIFLLLVLCLLLYASRNNGRYMISSTEGGSQYVLDTKTSKLWLRMPRKNYYIGTNNKPQMELIEPTKPSFQPNIDQGRAEK
jgi:hypothetical protein